jgi:hypothetical protein
VSECGRRQPNSVVWHHYWGTKEQLECLYVDDGHDQNPLASVYAVATCSQRATSPQPYSRSLGSSLAVRTPTRVRLAPRAPARTRPRLARWARVHGLQSVAVSDATFPLPGGTHTTASAETAEDDGDRRLASLEWQSGGG